MFLIRRLECPRHVFRNSELSCAFEARLVSLAEIALASMTIGLKLFLSGKISSLLGHVGLQIISRLTGLFVCALAAQIIFTGIKGCL